MVATQAQRAALHRFGIRELDPELTKEEASKLLDALVGLARNGDRGKLRDLVEKINTSGLPSDQLDKPGKAQPDVKARKNHEDGMYRDILTPEQETKARIKLCHEDHCLRCDAPLLKAEERFLGTVPSQTKKHRYLHCFVICRICYEDKKGTLRWFNSLDDQELLYMAKDRSCFSVTI